MASREITRQFAACAAIGTGAPAKMPAITWSTGQGTWSDEEFYQSGQIAMEEDILNDLSNICQGTEPRQMKVLEIGCGAGRVTRAPGAILRRGLRGGYQPRNGAPGAPGRGGFPNAHVFRNNGKDLSAVRPHWWNRLGFGPPAANSILPSRPWSSSTSRAAKSSRTMCAKPTGCCVPARCSSFRCRDLRARTPSQETVGWGFRSRRADARGMAERCGFEMRYHHGAGDQYYWLWFFKTRDLR